MFSPLAGPGEQEEYVRGLIKKYFEGSKMEVVCSKDGKCLAMHFVVYIELNLVHDS